MSGGCPCMHHGCSLDCTCDCHDDVPEMKTMPTEAVAERWGVWCEHADGRRYWMGDSQFTQWTQEVAVRVAKHMNTYEAGAFTAKLLPPATPSYRMTVRNAPPGVLLLRDGVLVFKTEYHKPNSEDPECYVLASGEVYCGEGYDVDCIEVTDHVVDAAREEWETA